MAPLLPPGQALVRARELCLLGDYEQGMREFQSVIKDLKRQCAFSAAPEVRQVSRYKSRYRGQIKWLSLLFAAAGGSPGRVRDSRGL